VKIWKATVSVHVTKLPTASLLFNRKSHSFYTDDLKRPHALEEKLTLKRD